MLPTTVASNEDSYPTRSSLLERVKDPAHADDWEEFYRVYGGLIRGFALKAGLTDAEADEVVQETMAGMAQHLPGFRYDPARCSFKTWLMNHARWRVLDQFRRRLPGGAVPWPADRGDDRTPTVERIAEPAEDEFARCWEAEWRQSLVNQALESVRQKVEPRQWQIFDLYVLKGLTSVQVARAFGIGLGRVYLVKHRVNYLVRAELKRLESSWE